MNSKTLPIVVLFGRTNVGKSTLFNKLTGRKQALVSEASGTTRDPNRGTASWQGADFELVDTGGIIDLKYLETARAQADGIDAKVQTKARDELKKADLALFLVDAREGLSATDRRLARLMQTTVGKDKPVILVANKSDNPALRRQSLEFLKLGLGEALPVSAANGSGTGDLLDAIVKLLADKIVPSGPGLDDEVKAGQLKVESEKLKVINIAIIGKPNVGKSSLLNAILKEDRAIVAPTPHTTREPQDTALEYQGKNIVLVDTAGISRAGQRGARQAKKRETLEKYSIGKSLAVLKRADVALLVLDITEGAAHQEARLVDEIIGTKTSLVIVANKWDLDEERSVKEGERRIYARLPFVQWAAIIFVSAKTGEKVHKVMDLALEVVTARRQTLKQSELNTFLKGAIKNRLPQTGMGSAYPRLISLKQVESGPPVFALKVSSRSHLHPSYLKYLENRLRERFGFVGTPVTVYVEKGMKVHGQADR